MECVVLLSLVLVNLCWTAAYGLAGELRRVGDPQYLALYLRLRLQICVQRLAALGHPRYHVGAETAVPFPNPFH